MDMSRPVVMYKRRRAIMPRRAKRGRRQHCSSSLSLWCDLPDDLLRDVLQRLPALGDRLRFAAVCRAWRAAERSHYPRPAVPRLVAPGHCVSLHDAAIHRVCSLHGGATDVVCRGSFDNWLAMVPTSSPPPYQPFLLNPFTMATVKLPMWTNPETITKVVMSAPPPPPTATAAAASRWLRSPAPTRSRFVARLGKIFVCHLPGRKKKKHHPDDDDNAWSDISRVFYVQDIVFLEGKLYAVTEAEEIFAFDDADIEHYSHLPSDQWRWTHVDKQAPAFGRTEFYLVACHTMGKVLVVSRDFGRARFPDTGGGRAAARYHTSRFKVYVVEEHDSRRGDPGERRRG